MRPRTTGISATTGQQQQQPPQKFKPKSEWKHENETSFLSVYLPGFVMQQLTITSDNSNGTVKVTGQRRLPNDRILPVDETFDIPQDCDMSKMEKQFGRGILMLKMPRHIVNDIPQQTAEEESPKSEGPTTIKTTTTELPKETSGVDKQSIDDITSRVPTTIEEIKKDGETSGVDKQSPDYITSRVKETKLPEGPDERKEKKEESKETDMMSSGSVMLFKQKEKESDESARGSDKKGVKNEDRKLLIVNMGVALLIIMGLGASLLYTMSN